MYILAIHRWRDFKTSWLKQQTIMSRAHIAKGAYSLKRIVINKNMFIYSLVFIYYLLLLATELVN